MMKRILYILAAAATVAAAASCKKEIIPDELDITYENELAIPALGGNVTAVLSANNPCTITVNGDWLEASTKEWTPDPEKKTKTVFFSADVNADIDERTAVVTVQAGSLTKTLEIIQAGKTTITADENTYRIDEKGGEVLVKFKTNVDCTMETASTWVRQAQTKALRDETFALQVDENTTEKDRTATITISGLTETMTVKLIQSAAPVFDVQSDGVSFSADGLGKEAVTVRTNLGVIVGAMPEWMSVEFESQDLKPGDILTEPVNVTLSLTAQSNLLHAARSGEFKIEGMARENCSKTLPVEQKAAPYCVYYTTVEMNAYAPIFYGSDLTGTIVWGDGKSSNYESGRSHRYDNAGEHTVCVSIGNAGRVRFQGIKGITKIDLRSF